MDLIPIIEYTLLIFIGLLILVVLTSYLVFMLRKNKSEETEQETEVMVREFTPSEPEVQYLIPVKNEEQSDYKSNYNINPSVYQSGNGNGNGLKPKTPSRFTILNNSAADVPVYSPERMESFNHRFASSKSTDAFAMFK